MRSASVLYSNNGMFQPETGNACLQSPMDYFTYKPDSMDSFYINWPPRLANTATPEDFSITSFVQKKMDRCPLIKFLFFFKNNGCLFTQRNSEPAFRTPFCHFPPLPTVSKLLCWILTEGSLVLKKGGDKSVDKPESVSIHKMAPKERFASINIAVKKLRKVEMVNDMISFVDTPDAVMLGRSAIEAKGIVEAVRPLTFLAHDEQTISLRR
jgi:hypothetical protein